MECSDMRSIYEERAKAALDDMDDEALVESALIMEAIAKANPRKKDEEKKGENTKSND